jgi:hypothetical protein
VIRISKPGYFTQVKASMVSPGSDNFIKAQLIKKLLVNTFNVSDGATVNLQNGARLSIPQSAIQTVSGGSYNGKVNVYMHWMDPANVQVLYQMPGELRGITTTGTERMMITFGMINVELESEASEKLRLDPSKQAILSFPVPADLATGAPQNVPMWHFDEVKGRWMEDGIASLSGNVYTTKVNHFSCWNVDAKYDQPLIKFCVKVIDENEKPYSNSHILIRRANDRWGAHGHTNGDGYVCGTIPANTPLLLEVLGEPGCDQAFYSTPIGPFSQPVDMITVMVRRNPEKTITVRGKAVDCNNQPVQKGYIQATIRSQGFIGKVKEGFFEFTLTRCPADQEVNVFGFDELNNRLSDQKTLKISGNSVDAGTVVICGNPSSTINNGLIAHYPLDGDAKDMSGNNLDGVIMGKPLTVANRNGTAGKAMHFEMLPADSQFISIPNTRNKNPMPMSVSLWCKVDNGAPDGSNIFNKYYPTAWTGYQILYNKDAATGTSYVTPWYLNSQSNRIIGGYGEPPFNVTIPVDVWKHIVFTVDYSGAKIYVDGKLVATKPWTGTAKPTTNEMLWKIAGYYNNWFKGSIDDIRIYNRALLDFEVDYLFKN